MARRRFQDPRPWKEGNWWWLKVRQDEFRDGQLERIQKRVKVCEARTPEREARKIAAEMLRPMNQGLETIGSATRFSDYITTSYKPYLEGKATTTQSTYTGTLRKYILPVFGDAPLRNITPHSLQAFFSGFAKREVGPATVLKIKEVLSSAFGRAVHYGLLIKNPMEAVEIPRSKVVNRRQRKPHLTRKSLPICF